MKNLILISFALNLANYIYSKTCSLSPHIEGLLAFLPSHTTGPLYQYDLRTSSIDERELHNDLQKSRDLVFSGSQDTTSFSPLFLLSLYLGPSQDGNTHIQLISRQKCLFENCS